jgi:hypothetical protein
MLLAKRAMAHRTCHMPFLFRDLHFIGGYAGRTTK